jgi:hypothetical protein
MLSMGIATFAAVRQKPSQIATDFDVLFFDRYIVPNPSYKGKAKKQRQSQPESTAAATTASIEEHAATLKKHSGEVTVQVVSADQPSAAGAAGEQHAEDVPKELMLLKGVTGYAEPGILMALMGGSGELRTQLEQSSKSWSQQRAPGAISFVLQNAAATQMKWHETERCLLRCHTCVYTVASLGCYKLYGQVWTFAACLWVAQQHWCREV